LRSRAEELHCHAVQRLILCGILFSLAASVRAGEIPDAELIFEASLPKVYGLVPEAAPPRFVLLDNGRFFVGGTSEIAEGRLEGGEHKALRKEIERARKVKGLSETVSFGSGNARYRLVFRKGPEIVVSGDPAQAPFAMRPLAALIERLLGFDHESLRRIRPESYRLMVNDGRLPGGCRAWTLPAALVDALHTQRIVPAAAVAGWPTGATPASVCASDKTYVVALRPMLPGERP
jgi:hypothetical protein